MLCLLFLKFHKARLQYEITDALILEIYTITLIQLNITILGRFFIIYFFKSFKHIRDMMFVTAM